MTLASHYSQFRKVPTEDVLAEDAVISYIPTIVTVKEPAAILKHLATQSRQLTKKTEKVLSSIEGPDGLCQDVETTLEFKTGGGAYLPGLDDNFLAERVVTFPVIHIVTFDGNGKIQNIRLHWDQGSLLRLVEVIGARGKNWPIREAKDQIRLIELASKDRTVSEESSRRGTTSSRDPNTSRPQSKASNKSATNDRHQSLSLFGPQDDENTPQAHPGVARRASAKPAPRDMSELFTTGEANPETPQQRRPSANTARSGAGKNYHAVRLFEEEDEDASTPVNRSPERSAIKTNPKKYGHFDFGDGEDALPDATPESSVRTNSKKYNHFDFGDGEDAATPTNASPSKSVKTNAKKYNHFEFGNGEDATGPKGLTGATKGNIGKHNTNWDFEDFTTPSRPTSKGKKPDGKKQDVRHFGWSDDEVEETPMKRNVVHHERPDARPHFEFVDDGTPKGAKPPAPSKGRAHNNGLGLYSNHVTGDDEEKESAAAGEKPPARPTTTTNVSADHRRKDFGAHWQMTDTSPGGSPRVGTDSAAADDVDDEQMVKPQKRTLSSSNKRVLQGLDASWDMTDDSTDAKKENVPQAKARSQGGDGMGARKGATRQWGFGDDSDPEDATKKGSLTQRTAAQQNQNQGKGFWDF